MDTETLNDPYRLHLEVLADSEPCSVYCKVTDMIMRWLYEEDKKLTINLAGLSLLLEDQTENRAGCENLFKVSRHILLQEFDRKRQMATTLLLRVVTCRETKSDPRPILDELVSSM